MVATRSGSIQAQRAIENLLRRPTNPRQRRKLQALRLAFALREGAEPDLSDGELDGVELLLATMRNRVEARRREAEIRVERFERYEERLSAIADRLADERKRRRSSKKGTRRQRSVAKDTATDS